MSKITVEEDPALHAIVLPLPIQRITGFLSAHGEQGRRYADRLEVFAREAILDQEESSALRDRMSGLLTGTANALKGDPPELTSWSWHDLPELAADLRSRLDAVNEYADTRVRRDNVTMALDLRAMTAGKQVIVSEPTAEAARASLPKEVEEAFYGKSSGETHVDEAVGNRWDGKPLYKCSSCGRLTVNKPPSACDVCEVCDEETKKDEKSPLDNVMMPRQTLREQIKADGELYAAGYKDGEAAARRVSGGGNVQPMRDPYPAVSSRETGERECDDPLCGTDPHKHYGDRIEYVPAFPEPTVSASAATEMIAAAARLASPEPTGADERSLADRIRAHAFGLHSSYHNDGAAHELHEIASQVQRLERHAEIREDARPIGLQASDLPLDTIRRASQAFLEAENDYMGQDLHHLDTPMRAALGTICPVLTRDELRRRLAGHWPIETFSGGLRCSRVCGWKAEGILVNTSERWRDHVADVLAGTDR